MTRGRWIQDEKGEFHEDPLRKPSPAEDAERDTEEQKKKREQDEKDRFPGNYI